MKKEDLIVGKKYKVVSRNNTYDGMNLIRFKIGDICTMVKGGAVGCFKFENKNWNLGYNYVDVKDLEPYEDVKKKPKHYHTRTIEGKDVIDLVKHFNLNFNEGNILKYLLRDKGQDLEDMAKIEDYARREKEYLTNKK